MPDERPVWRMLKYYGDVIAYTVLAWQLVQACVERADWFN